MRSSKSRSRSKSNRQRSVGNVINRVFDSSGPEGKVRGTPQQIIDKYLALARDAQLGNDRVAEQNFLQHAEHYTRMLGEAQREQAREQEQRQAEQQARQEQRQAEQQARQEQRKPRETGEEGDSGMDTLDSSAEGGDLVVDTPETKRGNGRNRRRDAAQQDTGAAGEATPAQDPAEALPAFVTAEPKPARAPRSRSRKPAADKSPTDSDGQSNSEAG